MPKQRRLEDTYRFPDFRPESTVRGLFGDPKARLVRLVRRGKKRLAACVDKCNEPSTTARVGGHATSPVATRVYLEYEVRRVRCRSCGAVKREKLPWLADNPFYTKRFAFYVGRRCRSSYSRYTRVSPQERSRARRLLRS